MNMPQPGDGHRRLELLTGTWRGKETMHPSDWDPQGGTAEGVNTSRVALGGFAVINDYEQTKEGKTTYEGHGIYTYDANEDRYTLYWLDSIGSPPEIFTGNFEGNVLTMVSRGERMQARLTYDMTNPDRMVSAMDMSADGKEWKRLFDAVYERQP